MSDSYMSCGEIVSEVRQVSPSYEKQTKKRQILLGLPEECDDHDFDDLDDDDDDFKKK